MRFGKSCAFRTGEADANRPAVSQGSLPKTGFGAYLNETSTEL
jgi:hypothetical protein